MNIEKILISGFGKFINKSIELNKGLNVIYGKNEAGKSTLHKFIEDFFYSEHDYDVLEKYVPWNSKKIFGGSLLINNDKDEKYYIYKDFLNNNIEVRNEKNEKIDSNSFFNSDEPEIGIKFLGVNKRIFRNTFSIKQLGSKTDSDLINDVKIKIDNISRTKDEKINIENVYKKLEKNINALKNSETDNSLKSLNVMIENLIKSKNKQIEKRMGYLDRIKNINLFIQKEKIMAEENNILKEIIDEDNGKNLSEVLRNILEKQEKLHVANKEIGNDELFINYNEDDYEKIIQLRSKGENWTETLNSLREKYKKIEEYERKIRQMDLINSNIENFVKIESDYLEYKENIENKNRINNNIGSIDNDISLFNKYKYEKVFEEYEKYNDNNNRIYILNEILDGNIIKKISEKIKTEKVHKITNITFIFIASLLVFLGTYVAVNFFNSNYYYFALAALAVPMFNILSVRRNNALIKQLSEEINNIKELQEKHIEEFKKLSDENIRMLKENECETFSEIRSKYNISREKKEDINEKIKAKVLLEEELTFISRNIEENKKRIISVISVFGLREVTDENIKIVLDKVAAIKNDYKKLEFEAESFGKIKIDIETIELKIKDLQEQIQYLLKKNHSENMQAFKDGIKQRNSISDKIVARTNLQENISELLGEYSVEQLEEKVKKINGLLNKTKYDSIENIISVYGDNIRKQNKLLQEIEKLDTELLVCESDGNSLLHLDEKIEYFKYKKIQTVNRINVIEKTLADIKIISESINKKFMDILPGKISNYIEGLTEKKYSGIYLDSQQNIFVTENRSDKKISVDMLSCGTIDQIYFSVRLALMDILSGKNDIPLIIDDCFLQYDNNRLENALKIVYEISKKRQIILLTCHEREKKILEKHGIISNYIQL